MLEKAQERRGKISRRIKMPGKRVAFSDRDPIAIARDLRAKSALGKREAKLAAAERKVHGG